MGNPREFRGDRPRQAFAPPGLRGVIVEWRA
jgi:hypothetical protein